MTTCDECKQPLTGHWHMTGYPVETLCFPCAKKAGYIKGGCPEEYPLAAQVGLPGVGPDHAQAEMLLRAESAPKDKPPTQAPRGQIRAVFVNPLREEFFRLSLAMADSDYEKYLAFKNALEWPDHLLEGSIAAMKGERK